MTKKEIRELKKNVGYKENPFKNECGTCKYMSYGWGRDRHTRWIQDRKCEKYGFDTFDYSICDSYTRGKPKDRKEEKDYR